MEPPASAGKTAWERVTINLPPSYKKPLEEQAEKRGMTLSAYLSELVLLDIQCRKARVVVDGRILPPIHGISQMLKLYFGINADPNRVINDKSPAEMVILGDANAPGGLTEILGDELLFDADGESFDRPTRETRKSSPTPQKRTRAARRKGGESES